MSDTQTLEPPSVPPGLPEASGALQPLDPEGLCELFDYFVQAVAEFPELDPDDLGFLESHLADCPTGRHSEAAFEDAMELPRGALRKGSLEHGLSSPQIFVGLNFAILKAWQESGADSRSNPSAPAAEYEDDLSKRHQVAAAEYPGEYVVLQGPEVLCHSSSRREAFDAYDQAHVEEGGFYPVLVLPDREEPAVPPVIRGRSLTT